MSNATPLDAAPGADASGSPDSANGEPQAPPAIDTIHQGDCVELLAQLPAESIDLAFADPPYNIGFKYDEYQDNHADEDYLRWCESWIEQLHRVVKPTGAFWLAIGDEYAAELKVAAKRIGFTARNWIVWYYTFGQNCTRKFNRSHAHLFHFVKDEERHTFNAADPAVRVPSARALVYGDRRANPTGRLPDDTWILRPQDLREEEAAFHPQDNTWYFSRVAGTFKERQGFHGCQMPEQLLGRIVRASSNEGDTVLDPFAGSGTTLAVAKKLGRHWLGFELSTDYVKYATQRIEGVTTGDGLHGPADPVRSAPTTAKGRRLKGHPMAEVAKAEGRRRKAESDASLPPPSGEGRGGGEAGTRVPPSPSPSPKGGGGPARSLRDLTEQTLIDAFHAASEGASLDWLLCRPDLQAKFAAACEQAGLLGGAYEWNRLLLKLRKSGKLGGAEEKKQAAKTPVNDPEAYAFAAEIAWARARAKHRDVSLDDLLCDPDKLAAFDKAAAKAAPGFEPHEHRWAALRLRKAAKKLKAEAVQYEFVVAKLVNQLATGRRKKLTLRAAQSLREQPGVYVIAGAAKPDTGESGYVGEAADLGERLASHLVAPPLRGDLWYASATDESLPSDAYRHALRWNLAHRLQPTLSIDLLADGATF
ncbi:DNA adenine methyltransferase YhdJ [Planctomycetes bacterium MalM25]|nr:DNA adenine methyltransferase YhdJ [Planctomycetes bacterium MalM25]